MKNYWEHLVSIFLFYTKGTTWLTELLYKVTVKVHYVLAQDLEELLSFFDAASQHAAAIARVPCHAGDVLWQPGLVLHRAYLAPTAVQLTNPAVSSNYVPEKSND